MTQEPLQSPDPDDHSSTSARIALAVGVPALFAALAYIPLLLLRSELPDRLASHFDTSGTPDGSMTVFTFVLTTGALLAVGAALCVGTAVWRPAAGAMAATTGFLGGFLGALGAGILSGTVLTQRGLDDWRDAGGAGWVLLLALTSATALGSLAAWLASRVSEATTQAASSSSPVMDLADGETVVWLASIRSVPLLLLGAATVVTGVVLIATTNWLIGAMVMASSVGLLALATVHVHVDHGGLRVRYGWLPRPNTHIDITDMSTASVIDVRPMEWGGWGYRGSLTLMRQAAVVHRAGPGIRVDLRNGKVFVVTIDDADTGVALLNALIARRADLSQPTR